MRDVLDAIIARHPGLLSHLASLSQDSLQDPHALLDAIREWMDGRCRYCCGPIDDMRPGGVRVCRDCGRVDL